MVAVYCCKKSNLFKVADSTVGFWEIVEEKDKQPIVSDLSNFKELRQVKARALKKKKIKLKSADTKTLSVFWNIRILR